MTDDRLAIFPPGVMAAIEQITDTGAAIQAGFKALCSDADAVITGSWTGAAANSIHRPWQQWETDFANHVGKVEHAAETVVGAVHKIQSVAQGGR